MTNRQIVPATAALLLLALAMPSGFAAEPPLATVGGTAITQSDVEPLVAGELRKLEDRRQELIATALTKKIEDKLIELQAAKEGITADQLIAREVDAKATPATDAEVDAWYEANKARIGGQPKADVAPRIRELLTRDKKTALRSTLIATLTAKYGVKNDFEAKRAADRLARGAEVRKMVESPGHPVSGPDNAPVTIVEFSDFQCPYCSRVLPAVEQVRKEYGDKVRLVFRQYPLQMHPNAQKAAEASLCAAEQGKFWEMYDAMFKDQQGLAPAGLKEKATALGMDAAKFGECLDSGKQAAAVQADVAVGTGAGVTGTPAFFINGMMLSGAQPFSEFKKLIDSALAAAPKPAS